MAGDARSNCGPRTMQNDAETIRRNASTCAVTQRMEAVVGFSCSPTMSNPTSADILAGLGPPAAGIGRQECQRSLACGPAALRARYRPSG